MAALTSNLVTDASQTISNVQVTLLAFQAGRNFLMIHNASASNTLAVNLTGGTAAINGQGCVQLAAGGTIFMDTMVCTNAITAIGSAAGTVVTVLYSL